MPYHHSSNFLFPLSISAILFLHRVFYRFFSTLRDNMMSASAEEFRTKYPKVSRMLVSNLAPGLGASLAGLALAIGPSDERRLTITIYVLARAAEFLYNRIEDLGYMSRKPWVCADISNTNNRIGTLTGFATSGSEVGSYFQYRLPNFCTLASLIRSVFQL